MHASCLIVIRVVGLVVKVRIYSSSTSCCLSIILIFLFINFVEVCYDISSSDGFNLNDH